MQAAQVEDRCQPFHVDSLALGREQLRVFRCDWGWCVKRGETPHRARTLLDAVEAALGGKVEAAVLRDAIAVMERALTSQQRHTGRTAAAVLAQKVVKAA